MHTDNKLPVARYFLLVLALTIPGCTTTPTIIKAHSGPVLPPDQVAIIKPIHLPFWRGNLYPEVSPHVWIVDGKRMDVRPPSMIAVKPGEHVLSVRLVFTISSDRGTSLQYLSFEAEAGHTYLLTGKYDDGNPLIWMEDTKSQHVVAGRKPE